MYILLSTLSVLAVTGVVFINQARFGRNPQGERLERILKSPHYRDGKFQNLSPTPQLTSDKSKLESIIDFLFRKVDGLRPSVDLPVIKTDLTQIQRDEEVLVWLGHSSFFMQTGGKRFLIDPVLVMASPVSFANKAFKGTELYTPDDIPEIDYLIISHDHWDHLDYNTVMQLKDRTDKVICPLGVGEHFEYWGFDKDRLVELDWNEDAPLAAGFTVHCLPARHFSGRGFSPNKTLWASYMLQTPSRTIYISGDGGYDTHFAETAAQFGHIDLAIFENGQYNEGWKFIHLLPEDLAHAIKDIHADRVLTVHHSKYALGKHSWREPLETISTAAEKDSLNLLTPMIGEAVYLDNTAQTFSKWWENVN